MKPLTLQQQNVLTFLHGFVWRHGFAPTLQEIGDGIGLNYASAVRGHLSALEKKGYITRVPDKARSIRVLSEPSAFSKLKRGIHEALRTDEGVLHSVVYGLGWVTWCGKPFLAGEVGERVTQCFERQAVEHGWKLLERKVEPNHVLAVVKAWPNHSPELVVRRFKKAGEVTARSLLRKSEGEELWARGYAATTDIELLEELVRRLLAEQTARMAGSLPESRTNR